MKNIGYAFFLGVLIATIIMYFAWKHEEKGYRSIIAEKEDTLRYERNSKGRIVAEKIAAEATVKQLKDFYPEVVRELKEEFDVKMKDMKAYVKNQIVAQGSGKALVTNNYYTDSSGVRVEYRDVNFDDGYLKFKSSIFEGLDFGESTYTYTDTISTVIYHKKNWLFGKERTYASTGLRNPNAKIIGSTNLLVSERDKRFVIYGGIGYDPLNNRPALTIGIGYAIIKF